MKTAARVNFALGGRVAEGLLGAAPALDRLADGNIARAIDFLDVCAIVPERRWSADAASVLGARFEPLWFLRT